MFSFKPSSTISSKAEKNTQSRKGSKASTSGVNTGTSPDRPSPLARFLGLQSSSRSATGSPTKSRRLSDSRSNASGKRKGTSKSKDKGKYKDVSKSENRRSRTESKMPDARYSRASTNPRRGGPATLRRRARSDYVGETGIASDQEGYYRRRREIRSESPSMVSGIKLKREPFHDRRDSFDWSGSEPEEEVEMDSDRRSSRAGPSSARAWTPPRESMRQRMSQLDGSAAGAESDSDIEVGLSRTTPRGGPPSRLPMRPDRGSVEYRRSMPTFAPDAPQPQITTATSRAAAVESLFRASPPSINTAGLDLRPPMRTSSCAAGGDFSVPVRTSSAYIAQPDTMRYRTDTDEFSRVGSSEDSARSSPAQTPVNPFLYATPSTLELINDTNEQRKLAQSAMRATDLLWDIPWTGQLDQNVTRAVRAYEDYSEPGPWHNSVPHYINVLRRRQMNEKDLACKAYMEVFQVSPHHWLMPLEQQFRQSLREGGSDILSTFRIVHDRIPTGKPLKPPLSRFDGPPSFISAGSQDDDSEGYLSDDFD